MTKNVLTLVRESSTGRSDSLGELLFHPKIREVVRVRASKMTGFFGERTVDRRLDAVRAVWEVINTIDEKKTAKLKTEGVAMAYLSGAVRNRMFRQVRSDLYLKEIEVVDDFGQRHFQLVPKIVRGPYDQALRQINALADPLVVIARREGVLEIREAVECASMSLQARRVLQLRLRGVMSKDIAKKMGRTPSFISQLLKEARRAVRDQLYRIRTGNAGRPVDPNRGGAGQAHQIDLHREVRREMALAA